MPAAISEARRSRIVYYAALGYSQREIAEKVGVSRNTVRKYLDAARDAVEGSDAPRRTLAAIVRNEFDWDRADRPVRGLGDLPM